MSTIKDIAIKVFSGTCDFLRVYEKLSPTWYARNGGISENCIFLKRDGKAAFIVDDLQYNGGFKDSIHLYGTKVDLEADIIKICENSQYQVLVREDWLVAEYNYGSDFMDHIEEGYSADDFLAAFEEFHEGVKEELTSKVKADECEPEDSSFGEPKTFEEAVNKIRAKYIKEALKSSDESRPGVFTDGNPVLISKSFFTY